MKREGDTTGTLMDTLASVGFCSVVPNATGGISAAQNRQFAVSSATSCPSSRRMGARQMESTKENTFKDSDEGQIVIQEGARVVRARADRIGNSRNLLSKHGGPAAGGQETTTAASSASTSVPTTTAAGTQAAQNVTPAVTTSTSSTSTPAPGITVSTRSLLPMIV